MDQILDHKGSFSKTVYLKRPFAQLNIATLVPNKEDIGYDVTPKASMVKVSEVPQAYNVATASPVGALAEITYAKNNIPDKKKLSVGEKSYDLVAMNYILVPSATQTSDIAIIYFLSSDVKCLKLIC